MSQQRLGADRGHQEVCGIGGRPHHQEDRAQGNQDAQGRHVHHSILILELTFGVVFYMRDFAKFQAKNLNVL